MIYSGSMPIEWASWVILQKKPNACQMSSFVVVIVTVRTLSVDPTQAHL